MFGMGAGAMLLGWIVGLIVLVLVVLAVIWAVRAFGTGRGSDARSRRDDQP